MKGYERENIHKLSYTAEIGQHLRVVVEATDPRHGDISIFEVRLGRTEGFTGDGVAVATGGAKRGNNRYSVDGFVTWDDIDSGEAARLALNKKSTRIRRLPAV